MPDKAQPTQRNANDADDCFLEARARVEQWQQEFIGDWFAPRMETMAKMLWSAQPDRVKNFIRQDKPDAAKKMDELMKEGEV